jgi:hypothetical protein
MAATMDHGGGVKHPAEACLELLHGHDRVTKFGGGNSLLRLSLVCFENVGSGTLPGHYESSGGTSWWDVQV